MVLFVKELLQAFLCIRGRHLGLHVAVMVMPGVGVAVCTVVVTRRRLHIDFNWLNFDEMSRGAIYGEKSL